MKIYYKDITNKWLCHNPKNTIKEYKMNEVFTFRKNKYKVDNHHVKYDNRENEKEVAIWLVKRINKRITLIPEIEYPLGIKHPDYRIGNEYYDLKTIYGSSKQMIYHKIRHQKEQSISFILYIDKTCSLKLSDIKYQINSIFRSNLDDRNWVKTIIVIYKNELFVYTKNQ